VPSYWPAKDGLLSKHLIKNKLGSKVKQFISNWRFCSLLQFKFPGYFSVDLSGKVDFLKNDDSNVFVVFDSFNVTPADLCSLESAALHHPYSNTHAIFPTIDKKFVQIKSHIYVQLISNYNNLNFGIRENFITGSQSTSLEVIWQEQFKNDFK